MTLTHSVLMLLSQAFSRKMRPSRLREINNFRNRRLSSDLVKGNRNGSAIIRVYLLPMNFAARLVDDNYCEIAVFSAGASLPFAENPLSITSD
jgi:hypothetical protein